MPLKMAVKFAVSLYNTLVTWVILQYSNITVGIFRGIKVGNNGPLHDHEHFTIWFVVKEYSLPLIT